MTLDKPIDKEHLDELELHVGHRLKGSVCQFGLRQDDRGLVLKGFAHSYHAKQIAQHIVMDAIDLTISANDIEVI